MERNAIIRMLKETNGNKLQDARRLGTGRRTLANKINACGIVNLDSTAFAQASSGIQRTFDPQPRLPHHMRINLRCGNILYPVRYRRKRPLR